MNTQSNLFADLPECASEELFTTLLENPHCRIERIVSYGQCSPDGFWYDQAWDEWVLLLKGSAALDLNGRMVNLTPGDHLLIPAGLRHRLCKTDPSQPTVWLAIHLDPSKP
ncbi:MAG: cupin domain-containing protein [Fluviibacter sp.]